MDATTTVSKLILQDVNPEDEGMYVCLASNIAGSNLDNAKLTVIGEFRNDFRSESGCFV